MKNKNKTDWEKNKNTIMWVLLVVMLVPFYPAITIDQEGGVTLPDNAILGVVIVLVAFFLFWKYMNVFQVVYSLYFAWIYVFNGSLGDFNTIPDLFKIQNAMFWIGTALLILCWEDELRAMMKKKKR